MLSHGHVCLRETDISFCCSLQLFKSFSLTCLLDPDVSSDPQSLILHPTNTDWLLRRLQGGPGTRDRSKGGRGSHVRRLIYPSIPASGSCDRTWQLQHVATVTVPSAEPQVAQRRRAGVTSGCDITERLKGCFGLVWIEVGNTQGNCLGGDENNGRKEREKVRCFVVVVW